MAQISDRFISKVELIMDSPTERNKYKNLDNFEAKLSFLRSHFIMDEMSLRLLERKYLLSVSNRETLMLTIEDIVTRSDN
jgi:phage-related protein